MLGNLLLYLVTVYYLVRHTAQTVMVRKSRRQNARGVNPAGGDGSESGLVSKEAREQLVLYTKLFLILGILWMFSTIHYILHSNHPEGLCHYSNNLEVFFRVIDSLNLLRGFFMFVIFVCKENVKNKVRARFGLVRGEHNGSVKTLHETTEMTEMAVG